MWASCGAAMSTQFQPGCDFTSWRDAASTGSSGWVQWMYVRGRPLPIGCLSVSGVV